MRYVALLGLLLFFAGCVGNTSTEQTNTLTPSESTVTLDDQTLQELKQIVSDLIYVQTQGAIQPQDVKILEVKEVSGLILVNMSVDGRPIPIYITKDKKYLVQGIVDKEELKQQLAQYKAQLKPANPSVMDKDYEFVGPVKGNPNASIVIVEFSDFQCPYCKRFYQDTLPQLQQEWIEPGKIAFYYRHLPLPFHEKAEDAAKAAYCAEQQGKFWEAHDWLFENLSRFTNGSTMAQELGLNEEEFAQCMADNQTLNAVYTDKAEAAAFQLTGTPSFIIIVPKDKVSKDQVLQAASAVRGTVYETPNQYIIAFSGAYPYQNFNQVLITLSG